MSAEFTSSAGARVAIRDTDGSEHWGIDIQATNRGALAAIPNEDAVRFAQAILDAADVTNALVLTDLPEVKRKASGRWHEVDVAGTRYTVDLDETADEVRTTGLAYLQIARWLEQNTVQPPDPQVEKLARLVREAEDEHPENAMVDYERIAKALIEAGVKVEVDE